MNENLRVMDQIRAQLTAANKLAVAKELYQLGEISKEDYSKMLHEYLENN